MLLFDQCWRRLRAALVVHGPAPLDRSAASRTARIRSSACDRVGTHPASMFESDVSEHPAATASWRWVRPRASRRERRQSAPSALVAMLVVVVGIHRSLAHRSERNCGHASGAPTPDEALADHGWRCAVVVARAACAWEISSAERLVNATIDAMARYDRPAPRRKRDRDALSRRRSLVLRDIGGGALIVANRRGGQTLESAARLVSALYGFNIPPTTASDWSLRWMKLQRDLGVEPPPVPSSGEAWRVARATAQRDRAEAELAATRESLAHKAERDGATAQEIPNKVAAAMRGDPASRIQSDDTQALAAKRLGKVLEAQAAVQALVPPPSDIVESEVELRRLGQRWGKHAST
jgi:hypothetical protein